jgi:hypothetical protein
VTGALNGVWSYLDAELWEPLAQYDGQDGAAPPDLFSGFFLAAADFMAPGPGPEEVEQARNDPTVAKRVFLDLEASDFVSESAMVQFLEAVSAVIDDYDVSGYVDLYKALVRTLLQKFNLRYRLDEPFVLCFLLPGSFANLYDQLHTLNTSLPHLASLLMDFEHAFNLYLRSQLESDLRTCIANASKYAEGLAGHTCGTHGSLGELAKKLDDWPHITIRDSLTKLYGFSSNYPNIRHAGNPSSAIRSLAARDATTLSVLFLTFSGYLSPVLDERAVLGI